VSLAESVRPLLNVVENISVKTRLAVSEAEKMLARSGGADPHGLNVQEIAALNLYTRQCLYSSLNKALREEDRAILKPYFPYLRLVTHALSKLPKWSGGLFRGVKGVDLRAQYPPKSTFVWWALTSCTVDGDVLTEPEFMGASGSRTLFSIECHSGRDISAYSAIPSEREVLLPPGLQFETLSSTKVAGSDGLQLITLKEVSAALVPFPRAAIVTGVAFSGLVSHSWFGGNAALKGCNGAYIVSPDGEMINGRSVFVHVSGTRFLRHSSNGIWMLTSSAADFARGVGHVRSASRGDLTPADVKGWMAFDGKTWVEEAGVTVVAMSDAEADRARELLEASAASITTAASKVAES